MEIEIKLAEYDEKPLVKKMLELHLYDMSVFDDYDLSKFGEYGYRYLDLYWTETERFPFILRVNQKLAGFALINKFAHIGRVDGAVAEFFILKKYRRRGIGKKLAFEIFQQFLGRWEVCTSANNIVAEKFWQNIIEQFAPDNIEKVQDRIDDRKVIIWTFYSQK